MFTNDKAVAHVFALEYIHRMHGGSQAKLVRCSDGRYYVIKFQNNPQGAKILANELLGTLMARRIGLPVPEPAIVEVYPQLVRHTEELVIEHVSTRVPCHSGLCFGSLYGNGQASLGRPAHTYDWLPDDQLQRVENLSEFLGMLAFDKWAGNADARQTIFVPAEPNQLPYRSYRVLMIDQGLCFNGANWNFLDIPRQGLCPRRAAYASVGGMEAFEPWLSRLDHDVCQDTLKQDGQEIPPEWYGGDAGSLAQLLASLDERRKRVGSFLQSTRKAAEEFFPAWLCPRESPSAKHCLPVEEQMSLNHTLEAENLNCAVACSRSKRRRKRGGFQYLAHAGC